MVKNNSTLLSILVPVRDEEANIAIMVKMLEAVIDVPHEVIIVYDTPSDKTIPPVKILQKIFANVRLVQNQQSHGVANAVKTGVVHAKGSVVLIFAADELGPLLAITDMLDLIKKGCLIVSCTRYAYGGRRLGGSMTQRVLSTIGNKLFKFFSGTEITDATTGIRMFRTSLLTRVTLTANTGWAMGIELAIKTLLLGGPIGEVPMISIDRLYGGKSTFKMGPWMSEYLRWFFYGIVKLRSSQKKSRVLVQIPSTTPL